MGGIKVPMTKYYGVLCVGCGNPIALAVKEPSLVGKTVNINVMPLEPIICSTCGTSHEYASSDAVDFDGRDGLLPTPQN